MAGINSKFGAVTFLDILGWKGIWARKDKPIEDLQVLINELKEKTDKTKRSFRGKGDILESIETTIKSISDTIVIFTETNEKEKYVNEILDLHGELCAKGIPLSIELGIPVRGATAYGEFAFDQNIYIGKAIDEAAAWYEQADWIGVFMTPSACFAFNPDQSRRWKLYVPPLKGGVHWKTPCIVWPDEQDSEQYSIDKITKKFSNMSPIVPDVIQKYTNTYDFLKHVTDETTTVESVPQ